MGCAASSAVVAHGPPGESSHANAPVSQTKALVAEKAAEKDCSSHKVQSDELPLVNAGVVNDGVDASAEETRQILPFDSDDESSDEPGYGLEYEPTGPRDVERKRLTRARPSDHTQCSLPPSADDETWQHKPDSRCWSSSLHGLRVSLPGGFDPDAWVQGDATARDASSSGIGIDLGTSAAVVSVWINGSAEIVPDTQGRRNHPMFLNFDSESGLITFGAEAKRRAARGLGVTVRNIKRLIGNSVHDPWLQEELKQMQYDVISGADGKPVIAVPFRGDKLKLHISHCMALMLRYLYTLAHQYREARAPGIHQDRQVVITTPSAFGFRDRQIVMDAAKIAGLDVMRMTTEPCAAAFSLLTTKKYEIEQKIVVFDLGAGTLDVSICTAEDGILEVKATMGDTRLGAEDFDRILVEHLLNRIKDLHGQERFEAVVADPRAMHILRAAAERAKCSVSFEDQTTVAADGLQDGFSFLYCLTRREFESIIEKLLAQSLELVRKCMEVAKILPSSIDNIVLVGGSTRIPRLQQLLEAEFGSNKIDRSGSDPDEAVAIGAAMQAAVLTGAMAEELSDILLLDVIPASVLIATKGGPEEALVNQNTTIPTKKMQVMTTANEAQETVSVRVMEGTHSLEESERFLGKILLGDITPAPAGVPQIKVTVDIDAYGVVKVFVKDETTQKEESLTITGFPLLSPDAMDEMISATETLFNSSTTCADVPRGQHTASDDDQAASGEDLIPWQRVTMEEALDDAARALSEAPDQLIPDANRGCYFPMYVMSVNDFLDMERLIPHEEALSRGLLRRVRRDDGAGDFFYPVVGGKECCREQLRFISHRWLSGEEAIPHPDTASNTKLRLLQRLVSKQATGESAAFIWMDFYSMPQARRDTAGLAIASLPFYVHSCGQFTAVLSDEYLHRAWCQVELIVSKLPVKDSLWRAKQLIANKTFVNLEDGTESPIPMTVLRNPRTCGIKCPEDLDGIMSLVQYVERTLAEFVAWDRSPSRRFEKRFGGKAAEPYCVDEDPECQRLGLKLADIELSLEQIRATA